MNQKKDVAVPESFFQNWGGKPSSDGVQPKFTVAQGTRLTSGQLKLLTEGKVPVVRAKGQEYLKVFVPGPGETFYSTIIPREGLKPLADDLKPYGINFSVSDQRLYGLE